MIYKIFREEEWNEAQISGFFAGSADDQRDGFIHFSAAHQVSTTLSKHFKVECNLILAQVADATLAGLRWEVSRGNEKFPHLYASLPIAAVIQTWPLRRNEAGVFILPAQCAGIQNP